MNNKLEKHFLHGSKTRNTMFKHAFRKGLKSEDIEDIVNDTFLKCHKALIEEKYTDESNMAGWVLRVCSNLSIDHMRSNNRRGIIEFCDLETSSIVEDKTEEVLYTDSQEFRDDYAKIEKALSLINKDQRFVIESVLKGMAFKEIAEDLELSMGTVLGMHRYGRINIQKLININN